MKPNRLAPDRNSSLGLALTLLITTAGCAPVSFLITPVAANRALSERVVSSESYFATDRIAIIELEGTIQNGAQNSLLGGISENPVALFAEKLQLAASDRRVKAIVIRINTPGGAVTASDLMYRELLRFKQNTRKPVIAAMLDLATSGGYYVACAADQIYATPSTVTGSIGVLMFIPEFSETMQKLGITANIMKSGELKDAGSPFRTMNKTERAVFQRMIDAMYSQFLAVVDAGRPNLSPDQIRPLADGRVYLGPQALELGLIDHLGDLRDAINAARAAAELDNRKIKIVQYARAPAYRPNVYAQAPHPQHRGDINLINIDTTSLTLPATPQFLYLWAPSH